MTAADWRAHPAYGAVPRIDLLDPAQAWSRLVVVSAHPDDESLGAGGLIAAAHAAGLRVYVVLLTAGEASHQGAPGSSRHALATLRLAEMENALARLAPDTPLVFLGALDGQVAEAERAIADSLTDLLGEAEHTLLVAPWSRDGHPDHDAAGRAARVAAERSGAHLLEYPVWFWQRHTADEAPWEEMVCLPLSDELRETKAAAIQCHASQVRPSSDSPDTEALLPGRMLSHFAGTHEHFVWTPASLPTTEPTDG